MREGHSSFRMFDSGFESAVDLSRECGEWTGQLTALALWPTDLPPDTSTRLQL
jgi:hypothetical protein